jgi:hypothetical protein
MSYVPPHKRKDAPVKITGEFPALAGAGAGGPARTGPTYVSRITLPKDTEVVEKEQKPVYEKTVESSFRSLKKEFPEMKDYSEESVSAGAGSGDGWITKQSKTSKKANSSESDWNDFNDY